jgi:hypothetical protein
MTTSSAPAVAPPVMQLSEPMRWVLWLLFGLTTLASLQGSADDGLLPLDRLLAALGVSLLLCAVAWFFVLALQRGLLWSLAMLIPYVNMIAIVWFARFYWSQGARNPALLGFAAVLAQLGLLLRLLLGPSGPLLI